ncbi:15634_t:CDS:2 [Entrophospora sp. SA101]|nr:11648_t:CDS:2 [Entrophospora sp. SA101]CAJ0647018.1 6041_t:CDS:2 [Entrophospora sp. SA101]CAJ0754279.1 14392_t:CDS:2 [Entrophospora sp. SA101]CAJ0756172.1 15634_t:CDS:2 [Entrophospora sp. SA101]CAJ0841724.1 6942_t:CDS:2 [Entrophospora sp. SA101]
MAIAVESNELNMDICVEKVNELNKNVCVKEVDQLTDAIEPNELNKDVGVSVEVNEMTVAVESNESNKDVGVEVNEVADAIEVNGMADANELNKDVCIEVNELIGAVETHELNKDVSVEEIIGTYREKIDKYCAILMDNRIRKNQWILLLSMMMSNNTINNYDIVSNDVVETITISIIFIIFQLHQYYQITTNVIRSSTITSNQSQIKKFTMEDYLRDLGEQENY